MKTRTEITIKVMTTIQPTEDPSKVLRALKNIFPELEFELENNVLVAQGKGKKHLEKIRNYIWQHRIIDSARDYLLKNRFSDMIIIKLHKQAALANKVNFCETDDESPMGSIQVIIETNNPELVIDWLAPGTDAYGRPKQAPELEEQANE